MTTFSNAMGRLSVRPLWLCEITLDYCANTYGSSPCTATYAEKCYKTYTTCRDKANFSKTDRAYRFMSDSMPVGATTPANARPYIQQVKMFPTEIKDNLATTGETEITFCDELDTDVGIDPHRSDRSDLTPRKFWPRFLKRNPNYINRPLVLYRGDFSLSETDYQQVYAGIVKNVVLNNDNTVTITTKDKFGVLEDAKTPEETDINLTVDLTSDATALSCYSQGDIYTKTFTDPATSAATSTSIVDTTKCAFILLRSAGNAQTIGDPTDKAVGWVFSVINSEYSGAYTISVNGITINPGECKIWLWDGSAWNASTISAAKPEGFAGITSSGYVRVDDEIIEYSGIHYASKRLTGLTRAKFGTEAATHNDGASVQRCTYFAPESPYTHMQTLLSQAGIEAVDIDTAAFSSVDAFDIYMPQFERIISTPTSIRDEYAMLCRLTDCKSWIGEALKFTITKNLPNFPGRTYHTITDASNIKITSDSVDYNEDSRVSRAMVLWNIRSATSDVDRDENYEMFTAIDRDGENTKMFGSPPVTEKIYCHWLNRSYMNEDLVSRFIKNISYRMLRNFRNPPTIYSFTTSIKDCDIATGEFVRITSDKIVNDTGAAEERAAFQIIRREENEDEIEFQAQRMAQQKVGFIAPTGTPSYGSATEAQKEYAFICDKYGDMPDFEKGWQIY